MNAESFLVFSSVLILITLVYCCISWVLGKIERRREQKRADDHFDQIERYRRGF